MTYVGRSDMLIKTWDEKVNVETASLTNKMATENENAKRPCLSNIATPLLGQIFSPNFNKSDILDPTCI